MKYTQKETDMKDSLKRAADLEALFAQRAARTAKAKRAAEKATAAAKASANNQWTKFKGMGSQALAFAKDNPTEVLIGIMALAIMDIEDELDEL